VLDRTLGLDKAVTKVALVEFSSPLPELAFMVLAAEGLGVGLEMVLRSNSPNNTKPRVKTPNSVTPRQVLRPVLSTLTNVANSTGSKWLPDLSPVPLFASVRSTSPLPLPSLRFLLAAHLSSSAFPTVLLIVVVFSPSCNTQITVITLSLPSIPYSMICGTIAQGRTIETPSLCTSTPLGFWWPIKCNNEHREDSPGASLDSEM
jgi:hypothetical protein